MRPINTLLSISLVVMAGSAHANEATLTRMLKAYYAKRDFFTSNKDAEGLQRLAHDFNAEGFVYVTNPDKNGNSKLIDSAHSIRNFKAGLTTIVKFAKLESHVDKVRVGKGSAYVHVTQTAVMLTNYPTPSNPPHKEVVISQREDTWVLVGGAWKKKLSKPLSETTTIDGKPSDDG